MSYVNILELLWHPPKVSNTNMLETQKKINKIVKVGNLYMEVKRFINGVSITFLHIYCHYKYQKVFLFVFKLPYIFSLLKLK